MATHISSLPLLSPTPGGPMWGWLGDPVSQRECGWETECCFSGCCFFLLLFWGVLLRGMLYSHRKKHHPLAGKAVSVTWDWRWCSVEVMSHIHANPQLSREHTAVLLVHKHMDAWACFPQEIGSCFTHLCLDGWTLEYSRKLFTGIFQKIIHSVSMEAS